MNLKNSNSTQLSFGFGRDETFQLAGLVAEFKFEYKFKPLPVIWRLLSKALSEGNRRF